MGGWFTKPTTLTVGVVNTTINKALLDYNPNTQANFDALNNITATNGATASYNTQTITAISNLSSLYEAAQNSDFQTTINNSIDQDFKKETIALISDMGAVLNNKNLDLTTHVANQIENLNIAQITPSCIANQNMINNILVNGSTANYNTQTIEGDFFQKCIGSAKSTMNTVSDMTNSITQKADVKEDNPLDFISKMFNGIMSTLIIFIIVIIGGIVWLFSGSEGTQKLDIITRNISIPAIL